MVILKMIHVDFKSSTFLFSYFSSFLSTVVDGGTNASDTLVFLPATSTAEMDVVGKERINQDGSS